MFDKIVWATDGSDDADATLALVTELAAVHDSKVIALHVDERSRGGELGGGSVLPDEDGIREKIEWQVDEMKAAGYDAEFEVVTGHSHDAAASIAATAAKAGADLIVVGTHRYGRIESFFLGSVARDLSRAACCPVLVVPPLRVATASAMAADCGS